MFERLTTGKMAKLIEMAQKRVLVAAPGIRSPVADALVATAARVGRANVLVTVDCDESVMRMGYGDLWAVQRLHQAGICVGQSSGFRAAVLICDDRGWVYTPIALYLEAEPQSDETPNALRLLPEQVQEIAVRLSPHERAVAIQAATSPEERSRLEEMTTEVGIHPVAEEDLKVVADNLKEAPPVAFEIARQVRVIQPYVQYVDMNLSGCAIERHRVPIPKTIQRLGASQKIERRLRTTFDLIEEDSKLSAKELDDELRKIREAFTRHLGKPWGRIMLRTAKPKLDERIAKLREKLEKHKTVVQTKLAEHIGRSQADIVDYYTPMVAKNPPDELSGQLLSRTPEKDQIQAWLKQKLDQVFPAAEALIKSMTLDVQFRDVTVETLHEQGFGEALRKAYPHVNWDKPFSEFAAITERRSSVTPSPVT
jgi:hypothetical protein